MIDVELDAQGLACPMPVLKAKMALNSMFEGQYLRVFTTDVGSVRDFHSFASLSHHELRHFAEHDDCYEFVFLKREKSSI